MSFGLCIAFIILWDKYYAPVSSMSTDITNLRSKERYLIGSSIIGVRFRHFRTSPLFFIYSDDCCLKNMHQTVDDINKSNQRTIIFDRSLNCLFIKFHWIFDFSLLVDRSNRNKSLDILMSVMPWKYTSNPAISLYFTSLYFTCFSVCFYKFLLIFSKKSLRPVSLWIFVEFIFVYWS